MADYKSKTDYNKVLGVRKDGQVVIVEYTFEYSDNFKGATGFEMSPLSQTVIDDYRQNGPEEDYIRDCYEIAVAENGEERSFEDYKAAVLGEVEDSDRTYFAGDDPSFRDVMEGIWEDLSDEDKAKIAEALGATPYEGDFVDWEVGSCGRCISTNRDDYSVILDEDLFRAVVAAESKS